MRKKKICVLLLCVALCVALFAGCSNDSIVGTWEGASPVWKGQKFVFKEDGSLDILRDREEESILDQYVYEVNGDTITTYQKGEDGNKIEDSYVSYTKKGKKLYFEDELDFVKK